MKILPSDDIYKLIEDAYKITCVTEHRELTYEDIEYLLLNGEDIPHTLEKETTLYYTSSGKFLLIKKSFLFSNDEPTYEVNEVTLKEVEKWAKKQSFETYASCMDFIDGFYPRRYSTDLGECVYVPFGRSLAAIAYAKGIGINELMCNIVREYLDKEGRYSYYWYTHGVIDDKLKGEIEKIILSHDYKAFKKLQFEYNNNGDGLLYFPDAISGPDHRIEITEETFNLINYTEYEHG